MRRAGRFPVGAAALKQTLAKALATVLAKVRTEALTRGLPLALAKALTKGLTKGLKTLFAPALTLKPTAAAALVVATVFFSGCGSSGMWWDYRDDPYIADMVKRGDQEAVRAVNSVNRDERIMGLRIVAQRAGEARLAGRVDEANRLEEIVVRRYFGEKDTAVRACIVRICAPMIGRGSDRMVVFLRERIAAGEFPGYAALSLASLSPRNVFVDIEPLTRHPAPEVRLQAAIALTVLRDPRGFEAVNRTWRGMREPAWPDRVEGVSLAEARNNLAARAQRAYGRPLFE